MNVVGIIAEFNPFHLGHKFLLDSIRRFFKTSCIICVMSGNFTQRGEIAVCNKWARAEMAVCNGADIVIELPFAFAVRSAYFFARGGVQMLDAIGVCDYLAFGSESGSLDDLYHISEYLAQENSDYRSQLQTELSEGLSFPAARARALSKTLGTDQGHLQDIIRSPNNILAVEYMINLQRLNSSIKPFTIKREGQGYDSTVLEGIASASGIRRALEEGREWSHIKPFMPEEANRILLSEIEQGRAPVFMPGLEKVVLAALRWAGPEKLAGILETDEGLHNRIRRAAMDTGSYEELRAAIKSKRYSMTRINRVLLYAAIDYQAGQAARFAESGPQYARVLAFSSRGQKVLKKIKANGSLPVLSRGSDVKALHNSVSNPLGAAMIDMDIRAGNIYTLAYPGSSERLGLDDYRHSARLVSQSES